jgi:hypothetical protein
MALQFMMQGALNRMLKRAMSMAWEKWQNCMLMVSEQGGRSHPAYAEQEAINERVGGHASVSTGGGAMSARSVEEVASASTGGGANDAGSVEAAVIVSTDGSVVRVRSVRVTLYPLMTSSTEGLAAASYT